MEYRDIEIEIPKTSITVKVSIYENNIQIGSGEKTRIFNIFMNEIMENVVNEVNKKKKKDRQLVIDDVI